MGSTRRFIVLVVAGLAAAVLPALLWLLTHPDSETDPAPEVAAPVVDVADVLEQRQRTREVERTDLEVSVSGEMFLEIEHLSRAPGEPAKATGLTLDLATLWTIHRGELGREIDGLWDHLPDDCSEINDAAARISIGLQHVDGTPLILDGAPVTLTRGPGGLGIKISADLPEGGALSVDIERVTRTGNVHLTVISGGAWPISLPWLPKGWSLRFGRIDLMGTAGLVLQEVQVADAQGGLVFNAERLTLETEATVPALLLSEGLPGASIGAEKALFLAASKVGLRWPDALQLPLLAELKPMAAAGRAQLVAERLTRSRDVQLSLEGLGVRVGDQEIAKATALQRLPEGGLTVRGLTITPGVLGTSVEVPLLSLTVDPYGMVEWAGTGAVGTIAPGTGDLLRLTVWGTGMVQRIKAILARTGGDGGETPAENPVDLLPDTRPLRDLLENHRIRCQDCALALNAGPVDMKFKKVLAEVSWEHASELNLRFEAGGVEGTDELSGPFVISAALNAAGDPARLQVRLGGEKISALFRRAAPGNALREGNMELDLSWQRSDNGAVFGGWVKGTDLLVEHRWIAGWPVRVPAVRFEVEGLWDEVGDRLEISVPRAELGTVWGRGAVKIGRLSRVRTYEISVDFPEQDCGELFRSIPRELVPHLADAVFQGSLSFRGGFSVDLEDLRKTIKVDLTGDWDRCRAVTLGPNVNVDALKRGDFVHRVIVKGEDLGILVGPGSGDFTQLHRIPKYVQAAAWGTEDLAFFKHHGFKLSLIRRALILLFERGYFAYGGSTVSQQLVKNLFLYRAKTLSRKLEEAVITWHMERTLTKERILELYLNCIEFGPRIWGIKRAARTYFGKRPEELSPLEGAFIMANKPDPPYGYYMYRRGKVNDRWKKKLKRVMDRLHFQMGAISAAQHAAESHLEPKFRKVGGDATPLEEPVEPLEEPTEPLEEPAEPVAVDDGPVQL